MAEKMTEAQKEVLRTLEREGGAAPFASHYSPIQRLLDKKND